MASAPPAGQRVGCAVAELKTDMLKNRDQRLFLFFFLPWTVYPRLQTNRQSSFFVLAYRGTSSLQVKDVCVHFVKPRTFLRGAGESLGVSRLHQSLIN